MCCAQKRLPLYIIVATSLYITLEGIGATSPQPHEKEVFEAVAATISHLLTNER